jgi:flagellar motor switch protein FliG
MAKAVVRASNEYERLNGRQKAAILCMAMGADFAARITQRLSPEEAETISFEIARMDQISGETVESVMSEWLETALAADALAGGGVDYAKEILEKAFGSAKALTILRRIQSQLADTANLTRLRQADPKQLGTMLRVEHPQTVALILAHLEAPHTAGVLAELEMAVGSEVLYRMATMDKVAPDMLQLLERSFGAETDFSLAAGGSSAGGPAAVAAVLNLVHASVEKELMEGVEAKDAALSEQIKNLMFVFEDISSLDDRALQRLLREVESKALALALKAASHDLKTKIQGAMSQRAVAALKDEMDMMGPVRMRDVEAAQSTIVATVRRLEEAGEIVLSGGADDLVIG